MLEAQAGYLARLFQHARNHDAGRIAQLLQLIRRFAHSIDGVVQVTAPAGSLPPGTTVLIINSGNGVVPVAILLVFVMLFATFRSLMQAGLIILNIPFALIGGVIALWVTGEYLSVPASVGSAPNARKPLLGIASEG